MSTAARTVSTRPAPPSPARTLDTSRVQPAADPKVPAHVIAAFGVHGRQQSLSGGTGRSVRVGDAVFKPVDDISEARWLAAHLPDLQVTCLRIPRPLTTPGGDAVVDGWTAAASDLIRRRRPTRAPSQLVHSDLSGNVLFAEGQQPAIIDVSLCWRPVVYAEAIVIVDTLLWFDADNAVLDLIEPAEAEQMLVRALIFRLLADDLAPGWTGTSTSLHRYADLAAILPRKNRR